ncbi:MAG: O-antigen ligase family protein [Ruminococcus sp.]|nr:O-antigen ligase family protein [Ruminococcus sp.]
MTYIKEKLNDTALFRQLYIIDLFFCYVSFLQIPAYFFLVFLFCWGVYLVKKSLIENHTILKLRFGLWIGAFLAFSCLSILINFTFTLFYSVLMLFHVAICFFVFYGMHTEKDFDFKSELFSVARLIVYISTIANIIGMICLMAGIRFEWFWIKFTIYENRFTGVFFNPNILGFISVVALVCCHMLYKKDLLKSVKEPRVSIIWLVACVATNLFSLMLCDSNASMVLALGYIIVYTVYVFFADKTGISKPEKSVSKSKIFVKIVSIVLVGSFLIGTAFMFRVICQEGFAIVFSKTPSIVEILSGDTSKQIEEDKNKKPSVKEDKKSDEITFSHENTNIDSGRFKLWKESINLFKISPIIGIANGNIVLYSEEYANGTLSFSYHKSDLHNGFLTILVSTGIIGFLLFCIFGFRFAKHAAQHLFLQKKTFRNDVYPCLFSFLFAYLFYAMFEKALLYDISFMVMWFWLMMGYTSCYIAKFEPMLESQYLFHKKRLTRTLL